MKNSVQNLTATIISLLFFGVVLLGVAGFGYELFSSNGHLKEWVAGIWEFSPVLLIVLGGVFLLVKQWMESINPGRALADAMIVCAFMSGLYILFKVYIGA